MDVKKMLAEVEALALSHGADRETALAITFGAADGMVLAGVGLDNDADEIYTWCDERSMDVFGVSFESWCGVQGTH